MDEIDYKAMNDELQGETPFHIIKKVKLSNLTKKDNFYFKHNGKSVSEKCVFSEYLKGFYYYYLVKNDCYSLKRCKEDKFVYIIKLH